jgi:hypothetical protein
MYNSRTQVDHNPEADGPNCPVLDIETRFQPSKCKYLGPFKTEAQATVPTQKPMQHSPSIKLHPYYVIISVAHFH